MTDEFLFQQVGRLSCLPYFGGLLGDGIRELAATLRECCSTEDQVRTVVDECTQRESMPVPADLRAIAFRLFQEARLERQHQKCQCGGMGWKIVIRQVRGEELSGAEPCQTCRPEVHT